MPEENYDAEGNLITEPPPDNGPRQLREALDRANAELVTLREQATASEVLAKENALYKAKLDGLNDAQRQAVLVTAADATAEGFLAQAQALGFVAPPEPAVNADELAAHGRIADAATGGNSLDPAGYDAELQGCRNEAEVAAVMAKYGKPGFYDSANSGNP